MPSFKDEGRGLQMNQWKKRQNRAWALDRLSHHYPDKAVVLLPHSFVVI